MVMVSDGRTIKAAWSPEQAELLLQQPPIKHLAKHLVCQFVCLTTVTLTATDSGGKTINLVRLLIRAAMALSQAAHRNCQLVCLMIVILTVTVSDGNRNAVVGCSKDTGKLSEGCTTATATLCHYR